jgi:hypothetical protein
METETNTESYSLFLSSFAGSPYYVSRNTLASVAYNINWDAVFNMNNHKYNKCNLRYEFISEASPVTNPFTTTADNGVLVLNGIVSRSTSQQGGCILGLIDVESSTSTNNNYSHISVQQNNFIASIPVGVGTTPSILTIDSTKSPTFMLDVGDTIKWYNTTAFTTNGFTTPVGYQPKTVKTVTGAYTYTLSNSDGTDFVNSTTAALVSIPFSCANPTQLSYTYMKSTTIQSQAGQSVEVPRGMRPLEVLLCQSNYGQVTNKVVASPLITGTNLQEWDIILNFQFFDPIPDQYTR